MYIIYYSTTRRLRVKHDQCTVVVAGKGAGLNTVAIHKHFDGTTASGRGLGGVTRRVLRGHGLAKSYSAGRETPERKSLPSHRQRLLLTSESARASSHPGSTVTTVSTVSYTHRGMKIAANGKNYFTRASSVFVTSGNMKFCEHLNILNWYNIMCVEKKNSCRRYFYILL